jgi:hypothetical protein
MDSDKKLICRCMKTIKTYGEEIIEKYKEKGVLLEPTRTDIKERCIARFLEGNYAKDEEFLRLFFKTHKNDDLLKVIEEADPEKFRTVQNFLLGTTSSTSKKNLDLIAWLLDFEPRPYYTYRIQDLKVHVNGSKKRRKKKEKPYQKEYTVPPTATVATQTLQVPQQKTALSWIKMISAVLLFSVIVLYGLYYFMAFQESFTQNTPSDEGILTNTWQQCMAWNGDEYELSDCSYNKHPQHRTKVIPFDSDLQRRFKKVKVSIKTRFFADDGITPLIWFYKTRSNVYEYYTTNGVHPIYGDSLRKITAYHIEHHIPKYTNEEKSFLSED